MIEITTIHRYDLLHIPFSQQPQCSTIMHHSSVQPVLVHLLEARPLPHRVPERREPVLALLRLGVRHGQPGAPARLRDGEVFHEREPAPDVRLELRDRARAVVREGPAREADEPCEPPGEVQVGEGELVAWSMSMRIR